MIWFHHYFARRHSSLCGVSLLFSPFVVVEIEIEIEISKADYFVQTCYLEAKFGSLRVKILYNFQYAKLVVREVKITSISSLLSQKKRTISHHNEKPVSGRIGPSFEIFVEKSTRPNFELGMKLTKV